MHRLAAVPGSASPSDGVVFIEQEPAAAVLLSSADTDLAALAALLDLDPQPLGTGAELPLAGPTATGREGEVTTDWKAVAPLDSTSASN